MNTQRTPTDQARADLAQRVSRNPLLQPFSFTPEQEQEIKHGFRHELEHQNIQHITLETEREDEVCEAKVC